MQRAANQLQADHRGDGTVNELQAMLPFLSGSRKAVKQADPHEITRGFGETEQRIARRDRADPGPAGGKRKGRGKQASARLPRHLSEAPQHQRREAGRGERMTPEGDQRVHDAVSPRPIVKSADIGRGVAKLYK